MKTQQELAAIAGKFAIKGNIKEVKPLGNGLINDTYEVDTDGTEAYVLQRINNAIFQDVELLQHNIECVTRHIRAKLEAAGAYMIQQPRIVFLIPPKLLLHAPAQPTGDSTTLATRR